MPKSTKRREAKAQVDRSSEPSFQTVSVCDLPWERLDDEAARVDWPEVQKALRKGHAVVIGGARLNAYVGDSDLPYWAESAFLRLGRLNVDVHFDERAERMYLVPKGHDVHRGRSA